MNECIIWSIISVFVGYYLGMFTGIWTMDRKIKEEAEEHQSDDDYIINLVSNGKQKRGK